MRTRLLAALVPVGAVVALATGFTPAPAATTATWTVTPGGQFHPTLLSTTTYLTDTTTGTKFRCDSFGITGRFSKGSGLTNPIGKVTQASGGGEVGSQLGVLVCGSGDIEIYITFAHLPWGIHANQYNAAAGETFGQLTKISATVAPQDGAPACTATIDGTAPGADNGKMGFSYMNTGNFHGRQAGSNLHFYNVNGCGGLISSGDSIAYNFNEVLYSTTGTGKTPNTITSP